MTNKRTVTYEIEHCNSNCPYFYHNFYDEENIWCSLLDKKIYGYDGDFLMFQDYRERKIPKECPLPTSQNHSSAQKGGDLE